MTTRPGPLNGRYALVAGGGTAGHLQPALAIAEALAARGHERSSIELVGSSRTGDGATLSGRGFPVALLPGRGIARSFEPRVVLRNLGAVAGLVVAMVRGFALVARTKPRVVVSVGGYASVAASVAAVVLGVPLVLVNVDAVPGAANRLFARFARASAVGWEGTPLPRAVVTGTPVRPEIAGVSREPADRVAARRALGLPADRLTVVVFGGSLGARRINGAVAGLAERWADHGDRSIYHIVGRRDWEAMGFGSAPGAGGPSTAGPAVQPSAVAGSSDAAWGAAGPPPAGPAAGSGTADGGTEPDEGSTAEVPRPAGGHPAPGTGTEPGALSLARVPYEDRMPLVYAAADVVVCRAGAMTVAELAVAGVPAVLVPLPGAPGDHQTANARMLERAGGAVLVPDATCDGDRLADLLDDLVAEPGRLAAMGRAAAAVGKRDAAQAGAAVVEANARPDGRGRPPAAHAATTTAAADHAATTAPTATAPDREQGPAPTEHSDRREPA